MTKARDIADGVDTADIADGAITTAKLADNSINATKLDVSGNGTAGQVLASDADGSFSWADASDPLAYTTVSGTTPSLDVGSYNFFNQGTLTGNTTLSFASVPTEAEWKYTFKTAGTSGAWDITTLNETGKKSRVNSGGVGFARGSYVGKNGTKYYVAEYLRDAILEYDLSTAYDITTMSFNQYYNIPASTSLSTVHGVHFKTDGTEMYVTAGSDFIGQFNLSTAWDISTASHDSSTNLATQQANPYGAWFKPDGTKYYIVGTSPRYQIHEYTMSTAWDLSTGSYTTVSADLFDPDVTTGGTVNYPSGIQWKSDGTEVYIFSYLGDAIGRFTASTAWDMSTLSLTSKYSFLNGDDYWDGFIKEDDGAYLYLLSSSQVTEYKFETPYTITLPSSVQNKPNYVNSDSQVTYNFFTGDSGTNVYISNENQSWNK